MNRYNTTGTGDKSRKCLFMRLNIGLFHSGILVLGILILLLINSCKDYLDVKPDKSQVVPTSLEDLQALLDNSSMNALGPGIGEVASDDYYVETVVWNSLTDLASKNTYIWEDDVLNAQEYNDWSYSYINVFYTNVVLDVLREMPETVDGNRRDQIKAAALFYRSFYFFHLAQVFASPYDPVAAKTKLGIPLRLTPDVNARSVRSSLEETYAKIIGDTKEAARLLPVVSEYRTRPGKAAAFGFLARIYFTMQDYKNAERYADSCLGLHEQLIDFNTLDLTQANPFIRFNDEVIFHHTIATHSILRQNKHRIDSTLYRMYGEDDLRKRAFFWANTDSTVSFRGSYDGSGTLFNGIAANEMMLIKAEAAARNGKPEVAIRYLNRLLEKRWKTGTFVPLTVSTGRKVLDLVLTERRKELVFRGLRWMDLRRLNKDGRYQVTLRRELDGNLYELPPNDPRYTFLIPEAVIKESGMQQNSR